LKSLVLSVALAGMITPATAHAFLEKASPAAGQTLSAGPAQVFLRFSEGLERSFSGASVTDKGGSDVAAGPAVISGAGITLPLKKLAPGRYRVTWHAVSLDTHRTEGSYDFQVQAVGAAPDAAPSQISVTDAWIRALPGNLPSGGYFTLHNGSASALTLSGASSPACGMLMLHKSQTIGGMASMDDVPSIDVPAGGTLKFAPGGFHLMCMDPSTAIKPGSKIAVVLEFAGGRKTEVEFAVRGANGH
jgi:copper(I)-binding protein